MNATILKARTPLGDDEGAAPAPSVFKPLVDKVAVPIMWFGIGYLVATFMGKR
jgi:hypothetical protein